jgi:hypothetical protein
MKRYEVLGTTDEQTVCDLCGRTDLKSTVALSDKESGETVFFGSDCAARATGWTLDEVKAQTVAADQAKRAAADAERTAAAAADFMSWETFLQTTTGETDITAAIAALGGFTAARAAYRS